MGERDERKVRINTLTIRINIMEDKLVLTKEEHLPGVALSLIGICLPQEYQLRVYKLVQLAKEKGLGNITIDDAVSIEHQAAEEMAIKYKMKGDD